MNKYELTWSNISKMREEAYFFIERVFRLLILINAGALISLISLVDKISELGISADVLSFVSRIFGLGLISAVVGALLVLIHARYDASMFWSQKSKFDIGDQPDDMGDISSDQQDNMDVEKIKTPR